MGLPTLFPSVAEQYSYDQVFRPWPQIQIYMAIYPFIYACAFTVPFLMLQRCTQVAMTPKTGAAFGGVVFLIGQLPVYLLMLASLRVSPEIVCSWIFQSCAQLVASGMVVGMEPFHLKQPITRPDTTPRPCRSESQR